MYLLFRPIVKNMKTFKSKILKPLGEFKAVFCSVACLDCVLSSPHELGSLRLVIHEALYMAVTIHRKEKPYCLIIRGFCSAFNNFSCL